MCVFEIRRETYNESETEKFQKNKKIGSCNKRTAIWEKKCHPGHKKKKKIYCKSCRSNSKSILNSEEVEAQGRNVWLDSSRESNVWVIFRTDTTTGKAD